MRYHQIVETGVTHVEYQFMDGPDTYRLVQDTDRTLFKRNSRIRYIDAQEMMREKHVIAMMGSEIVGIGGVQINPHDPENLWIKFISVDPKHQNRGIAKAILYRIYQYADENGLKFAPGGFTEEGERLRHLHDIYDQQFPNVAYRRDERGRYVNDRGIIMRDAT